MARYIMIRTDLLLIGTGLYLTKPNNASFNKYFKNELNKTTKYNGYLETIITMSLPYISNTEFNDLIFVNTATVSLGKGTALFIGILGNWFEIYHGIKI